jgi:hypothetical protein
LGVVLDGRNSDAVGRLLCENRADVVGLPLSVGIPGHQTNNALIHPARFKPDFRNSAGASEHPVFVI